MANPTKPAHATELEALISRFDRLTVADTVPDDARAELIGLAGIHDLDVDRPVGEIWVDLRAVLVEEARSVSTASAVDEIEPLTLLVVEDDPEMAADLTAILTDAGHRVVGPFHDAEAAEAATALHAVDLALLDINLSGATDGVALADTLKSRWGVPVMFLSGDLTRAASHAHLAEALVVKPFSGREVIAAVSRVSAAQSA